MITFKQYMLESSGKSKLSVDKYGVKRWYYNTKLHREDGPAVIYPDGYKEWLVNGKFHRLNGPAIEHADGDKSWYVNGKLHRLDGPAIEYANGSKFWYVNGKEMTENDFNKWKWKHDQHETLKKASAETGIELDI